MKKVAGTFVTFEGIEGSGKSTLLAGVARRLREGGRDVLTVREPGGTVAGDAIRRLFLDPHVELGAMTELLLVNASRAQLLAAVVRPALERGTTVLCDRYVDSTLAYQGYGRGLDLSMVRTVCDAATSGLEPDLTLLVDVSVETSRMRVDGREHERDRIDVQDAAFHERVRSGFLQLSAGKDRMVRIDGERAPDQVLGEAMAALASIGARV